MDSFSVEKYRKKSTNYFLDKALNITTSVT